ncbi:MAG: MoaD/ThiS family protein [Planctomycetes bacterium]|nr:MoaD/ThiS family protein [Planctomycetota bacterium]
MPGATTVTINVPAALRYRCGGAATIVISAATVRGALEEIEKRHADLYRGICDDTGAVRRHVNVFVNETHMRDRDGLDTKLSPGDELSLLPAVSGG